MNLRMGIKGMKELKKALKSKGNQANEALAKALYQEAETIMNQAKRITPVDTGTLRNSGHVQQPKITRNAVEVMMGFGGAAEYAIYVHENIHVRHRVGQAKFLEQPLNQAASGLSQRLASRIRDSL